MLIMLARDFRFNIFTTAISISLVSSFNSKLKWLVIATEFVVLYFFSCFFRLFGFFNLDHVHNQHQHLGLIDLIFIFTVGYGISIAMCLSFDVLFALIPKIFKKIPQQYLQKSHYSVALVYFLPWIPVYIITGSVYSLCSSKSLSKQIIFMSYILYSILLPQRIAWFINIANYSMIETLNIYDAFSIFCYLSLLLTIANTNKSVKLTLEAVIVSIYIGISGQDLLYRPNLTISLFCLYLAIKLYVSKNKERIED